MSEILPLFPLRIVVFPNESLNLHIFEPRYKQLIQECETDGITFGIPTFVDNALKPIGTEIELLKIAKIYPDGKLDIHTKGIRLFKINEFFRQVPDKLYAGATVDWLPEEYDEGDPIRRLEMHQLISKLFSILDIKKEIPSKDTIRCFEIGHHIGLNTEQEYQLLIAPTETERQEMLIQHLTHLIPIVEEMERLKQRIQLNGHFKNLTPPEI